MVLSTSFLPAVALKIHRTTSENNLIATSIHTLWEHRPVVRSIDCGPCSEGRNGRSDDDGVSAVRIYTNQLTVRPIAQFCVVWGSRVYKNGLLFFFMCVTMSQHKTRRFKLRAVIFSTSPPRTRLTTKGVDDILLLVFERKAANWKVTHTYPSPADLIPHLQGQ